MLNIFYFNGQSLGVVLVSVVTLVSVYLYYRQHSRTSFLPSGKTAEVSREIASSKLYLVIITFIVSQMVWSVIGDLTGKNIFADTVFMIWVSILVGCSIAVIYRKLICRVDSGSTFVSMHNTEMAKRMMVASVVVLTSCLIRRHIWILGVAAIMGLTAVALMSLAVDFTYAKLLHREYMQE